MKYVSLLFVYKNNTYIEFQVIGYHVPFFQVSFGFGEHIVSVFPFDPHMTNK